MNVPVTAEHKSHLQPRSAPTAASGPRSLIPMPPVAEPNTKSSLSVGNRVLVNGLKTGTLRYIGAVQFAQGTFCGVELDQADGKHDGEVKDIRYFQCALNHGIFVPSDKVIPAPRPRTTSSQRPVSRLKPPGITRSVTLTSSSTKPEPVNAVQLPDIVPNSTPPPVNTVDDVQVVLSHEPAKENSTVEHLPPKIDAPIVVPIDEPSDTIEADFSASVSLILHQLQQEQPVDRRLSSITISDDETDEDDGDDETDNESVVGPPVPENLPSDRTDPLPPQCNEPIPVIPVEPSKPPAPAKIKINPHPMHLPLKKAPVVPAKKVIDRKPVVPAHKVTKPTSTALHPRKPVTPSAIKAPAAARSRRAIKSPMPVTSDSRLASSRSSVASLASSQVDLTLITKNADQKRANQLLTDANERLKNQVHHLLKHYDLICILSQYLLGQNEQLKHDHGHQLAQARQRNDRLKTQEEELRLTYENQLSECNRRYQQEVATLNQTFEQQRTESQQTMAHLMRDKEAFEARCLSLQEQIDAYRTEMAESEHADLLLCHVERLEKDRTSLQSVVDLKNRELTQLRTKLHEQVFQLEDKLALEKRIDMAEKRNQDLVCLLRQWQWNEKATVVQRDEFKEQVAQLQRDYEHLKFENETLLYRLRHRSTSNASMLPATKDSTKDRIRTRARSLCISNLNMNIGKQHLHRSSSLILNL